MPESRPFTVLVAASTHQQAMDWIRLQRMHAARNGLTHAAEFHHYEYLNSTSGLFDFVFVILPTWNQGQFDMRLQLRLEALQATIRHCDTEEILDVNEFQSASRHLLSRDLLRVSPAAPALMRETVKPWVYLGDVQWTEEHMVVECRYCLDKEQAAMLHNYPGRPGRDLPLLPRGVPHVRLTRTRWLVTKALIEIEVWFGVCPGCATPYWAKLWLPYKWLKDVSLQGISQPRRVTHAT